ncbi:MAG: copper ion binding protein [Planctomycetota bacterium]
MKLLATSALALCLMVMIGCAEGNTPSADAAATIEAATNKVEANVSGMDCTGCSGSIEAAIAQIDGVTAATADVKTGDVKVALADDADTDATKAEIEKVIAGLSDGKFTVENIEVSIAAVEEDQVESEGETEASETTEETQADAAGDGTVFVVSGMSCSACSDKVTKAVSEIEGVESVSVCHKSGKCSVVGADGKKVCAMTVTKAIESTGFMVEKPCDEGCDSEGCDSKEKSEDTAKPQADAGSEGAVFVVSGMNCEACSSKLTKAVSEIEGVESVSVCHKSGKCQVMAADGSYVCPVKVTKAIESSGFELAQQ